MNLADDKENLIHQYLRGELDDAEWADLRKWVGESRQNKDVFTRTCALWELSSITSSSLKFEKQKNWTKIDSQINTRYLWRNKIRRWASVAAIFVFAFVSSYYTIRIFDVKNENRLAGNSYITNEAPLGNKSKITLPDGTEIWLNAGSKIQYATNYNVNDRNISLKGEAFFHVATNKLKPFVVHAQGVEVKATGTQFNVKAYQEEGLIETTLVEGIVSVSQVNNNKKNNQEILLKPNQKLTIYKKVRENNSSFSEELIEEKGDDFINTPIAVKKIELSSNVETPIYTSWKDDEWMIRNEKLESLAIKLGRRYDVVIELADNEVKNYNYTGTLKDETLEQVLDVISQSSPIKYKIEKKKVSLWYNREYK